jgi:aromatic ring-opening dioxygenase catalytic subunit (LigB family)
MLLPRALLVPHWPPLLEDELRRHRTPMLEALGREARRFAAERPEIAVVLSARWESNGPFHVGSGRLHRTLTDDPGFGVEFRYDCAGHPALARALVEAGTAAGVRVGPSERGVDGGVAVPMHFLAPSHGLRVVPLSAARRPAEECRRWGAAIRDVLERRPERIGLVVGGMLSHATHAWNFRRDVPQATQLDQAVLEALRAGDWEAIRPAADKWQSQAHPEAGLRHLEVLRGFLGADLAGEVLCYESGPGMGAALVAFPVTGAVSVAREEDLVEPVAAPAPPRRPRFESRPRTADKPRFSSRPRTADKPRFTSRPRAGDKPRFGNKPRTADKPRFTSRPRSTDRSPIAGRPRSVDKQRVAIKKNGKRPAFRAGSTGGRKREGDDPRGRGRPRREGASGRPGASAGSRTPRARGRAPASRPARKPRG